MTWTAKGASSWASDSADGSVIHRGSRVWPSGANATGDIGFLALTYPGTGAPGAHADWGTPIGVSTDADTAGSGLRTTYLYAFVYAGTAPNLSWNPGVTYTADLVTYRHSSEIAFTIGTAVSEKNADSTTHTLTGGVASLGTDSLILIVASNGRAQTYTNLNSTTPSTASGASDTTTAPSASAWIERVEQQSIGTPFCGLAVFDCVLNSGGTGNISTTLSAGTKGTLMAIAIKPGVTSLITITNPAERTVYDGGSGSKSVTFSGTYTGPAESVQIQIEKASDSSVVVAWTTIAASPSGGTWSGSVTIPRGGWYNAVVRKITSTGVTSQTTSRWGVGINIGALGQSHLTGFGSSLRGTGTPDDRANQVASTTPALLSTNGAGRVTFANALIALLDCPVTFIDQGVDGTLLSYWFSTGGGVTANYTAWAARVTAAGQGLSAFFFWQGDADAQANTGRSTYLTELVGLKGRVQTDFGSPLFVQGVLGRYNLGADSSWDPIRRAHMDFVNGDTATRRGLCCFAATTDSDAQHFDTAGNITLGARLAQVFADYFSGGASGNGIGPKVASAIYSGNQVRVTLTQDNGTDIAPASGISGFRVLDNGTPATISAAIRADGNVVRLTTAAPLTGPVTVDYGYGANPATLVGLSDNTAASMPLYPTADPVSATLSAAALVPVLSAGAVFNITATSVQPRVTITI